MANTTKWPLARMKIGDRIRYKGTLEEQRKVQNYCHVYGYKTKKKYATKMFDGVLYITRIEDNNPRTFEPVNHAAFEMDHNNTFPEIKKINWPWPSMKVDDAVEFTDELSARKAQVNVHAYAGKTGKKFATKSIKGIMHIWRIS